MVPILWGVQRGGEEGWTAKNGKRIPGEGPSGGRSEKWE